MSRSLRTLGSFRKVRSSLANVSLCANGTSGLNLKSTVYNWESDFTECEGTTGAEVETGWALTNVHNCSVRHDVRGFVNADFKAM